MGKRSQGWELDVRVWPATSESFPDQRSNPHPHLSSGQTTVAQTTRARPSRPAAHCRALQSTLQHLQSTVQAPAEQRCDLRREFRANKRASTRVPKVLGTDRGLRDTQTPRTSTQARGMLSEVGRAGSRTRAGTHEQALGQRARAHTSRHTSTSTHEHTRGRHTVSTHEAQSTSTEHEDTEHEDTLTSPQSAPDAPESTPESTQSTLTVPCIPLTRVYGLS